MGILFPVTSLSPVVDEVNGTNDSDLIELGLRIIEPGLSDVFEAADRANRVKQTSFQDQLCLLTAKRQGFTCITNDTNLRKACKDERVECLWGLELLLILYKKGGILSKDVVEIVEKIHRTNPKYITKNIVKEFRKKIKKIT
jgi:hypothetical protein